MDIICNIDLWNQQYGISKSGNTFLSEKMRKCREKRPKVKAEQKYTVHTSEENATLQLWIRTSGCTFSKQGSCTMCDYWEGDKLETPHEIVGKVLSLYKDTYTTLIFETCGSPLDENELTVSEQEAIWKTIDSMGFSVVIIETHALTINEEKLELLRKNIHALIVIEMGLESSDDDVLLYCLNKHINLDIITEKIELVHEYSMKCCVNILLGTPFLSTEDRMNDCINSIRDALRVGADTCAVFPVNIKEFTLVKLFYDNGIYNRVLGRELIEVLDAFSEEDLGRINIAWVKERHQNNMAYTMEILAPLFCDSCKHAIYSLLDLYVADTDGRNRRELVSQMMNISNCCISHLSNRIKREESSVLTIKRCYEYLQGI